MEVEATCARLKGAWEVVTGGKGKRGCGSPGSGKRLVGGLKVEGVDLRALGRVSRSTCCAICC